MPEIPDVETYKRYFNKTSLHQRIRRVHVESPSILFETSPQGLGHALKHKSFQSTDSHGKYLFAAIEDDKWLVMHFGMTGEIKYFQHQKDMPKYTRFLITFENGCHLAYVAPRKLGRVGLVDTPQSLITGQHLGPDALEITGEQFHEQAMKRRGNVKSWLMAQSSIAGIGNVYSDEILFHARIHPKRSVSDLDEATVQRLYKAMQSVLKAAIDAGADPDEMPSSFLLPHRNKGAHCPVCGTRIATVKASGRTAWYCPKCQT